jgi:dimethylglycine dehydrogenase
MKTHARVVVIGGGIAGCSVLYHLCKLGWTDVVLLEKGELTSGTTWHSVGNTPMFTTSLNLMRVLKASNELYQTLEAETGQAVGYHPVGSLRLASNPDLLAWYKHIADMAQVIGVDLQMLSVKEAQALNPLIAGEGLLGVSFVAADGYLDPSSVTHALAKGARQRGAEIYRNTRVEAITRKPSGEWEVQCDSTTITAEIVVNAAGQWGKEIGRMVGVELPLIPLEHQYLVTEAVPALQALPREIPVTRDPARTFYLRQEGDGLLIGFFEADPRTWAVDGIPRDFAQELLQPDLDRFENYLVAAAERIPVLAEAGIKKVVNGPDAYTPDGGCIIGYVPHVRNFFVLAGFSCFGIANSGGAGRYAAEWIVEGQPSVDLWELDVRRYGPYAATKKFLIEKACETYAKEYAVHYPHEERSAGRPIKTSPLHDVLQAQGAVFGARHGWERPMWFAPPGVEPKEELSLHTPNWFKCVGDECRAVRERVGVLDQTSFGKFEVAGPGAAAFLDHLCANRIPKSVGKIVVTQMLNERGGVECDLTVTRVAEDTFWVITAAATTTHDFAWIEWHLPQDGRVTLRDITSEYACLSLMGPRGREVLQKICDEDVRNEVFPFMSCRDIHIGYALVRACRASYVGELGWELYHPIEYQRGVYARIVEAGREFGIVNFGYRALDSLRMEKGFRLWGLDMGGTTTPLEAGLSRFVKWDKGDFVGMEALLRQRQEGITKTLACMVIEGRDAIPHGWEPLLDGVRPIGYVTSGDYGHVVGKTIALAYAPLACAQAGSRLEVRVLGERYPATVVNAPLYDPGNLKMKG